MPHRPYCDGDCPERNLSKIVDAAGNNAGLTTFVTAMASIATAANASFHLESEVVSLSTSADDPSSLTLQLRDGRAVSVGSAILNLPQQPMLALLRASPTLGVDAAALGALHGVRAAASLKLYVLLTRTRRFDGYSSW